MAPGPDTERLIAAARRLDVPEGVLDSVRSGLSEGRDAAWAEQELLKRAGLEPRQLAQLRRELESESGAAAPAQGDGPPEDRSRLETQVLPARPEPPPGRRASVRSIQPGLLIGGRFKIEEEIGHGSQGIVYRARDQSLHRDVAIKVLRGDAPGAARERFLREAQTVSRLRHPGIVLVYEAGVVGERGLYYAMELVRGESLEDVLERERSLEPARAVRILEAVALAVHHAHDAGLVHRDLKPGNVLLDGNDQPKIADFGLVTLAEGTRLTATRSVVGTPVYMAPEQAQGERVDRRADVYSLGAILYETLCGRPPFEGETPLAIFRKVVEEDPRPLRAVNPAVSEALERVCLRTLEKEPRTRYLTAAAFARDLRRALEGQALVAPGSPVPRRIRRGIRRAAPVGRRVVPFLAGLGLGALAGVLSRTSTPLPAPPPRITPALAAPDPQRAARRGELLELARAERGRGLSAAAIDWLRALGPEELRRDPGASGDLARARGLEALAWLDQGREAEGRRAAAEGRLWSGEEPLLLVAEAVLLAREGQRGLAVQRLEWALLRDEQLLEARLELGRFGPSPEVRRRALDAALAQAGAEAWPILVGARARLAIEEGDLARAQEAARGLAPRLSPGLGPDGPFALERALAGTDPIALRLALARVAAAGRPGQRELAQRALGLVR